MVAIQDEQTQNAFLSNAIAERLDVPSNELEVLGTLVARGPLSAGDLAANVMYRAFEHRLRLPNLIYVTSSRAAATSLAANDLGAGTADLR